MDERDLPIAAALTPALHGLWTDGYLVGALSSRAVLSHHLTAAVKADAPEGGTVTLGVDWAHWMPGDEVAARALLGVEGMGDGLAALLEHSGVVIKGIQNTLLNRLAGILADGVEKGLPPAKVAQAIRGLLNDPRWAYRIALTETTRAQSAATLERYARNGVPGKVWMTAGDQHVCIPCTANQGQDAIPINEPFEDGNYSPPGHVLCRCSLGPSWAPVEAAAKPTPVGGPSPIDAMAAGLRDRVEQIAAEARQQVDELAADVHAQAEEILGPLRSAVPAEAVAAAGAEGAGAGEVSLIEVRQALQDARSAQAVSRVFMDEAKRVTGRRIPAEFTGSAQTAREHAEGLLRGLERFPDAALMRVESAVLDASTHAEAENGVLRFNSEWTSDRRRYLASLKRSVEAGWHPAGFDNPASVALHEFGHAIDYKNMGGSVHQAVEELVTKLAKARDTFATDPAMARWWVVRRGVSEYASTETAELVAEAFADVMLNGDAASALSRQVYDLFTAAYERGGRTIVDTPSAIARSTASGGLERKTVAELRAMAREQGIEGASRMTKPQLLERLRGEPMSAKDFERRAAGAASGEDAMRAAAAGLDRTITGLTEAQEKAVRDYRGFGVGGRVGYVRVNRYLRAGVEDADAAAAVRAIDEAMAKSRLSDDVIVWRGIRDGAEVFGERFGGDLAGVEFGDAAYTSTARSLEQAENISRHGFGPESAKRDPLVMRILAPRGTGAIEASDTELLLDRDLRFRVVADHGVVDGARRLDIEVLPKIERPAAPAKKATPPAKVTPPKAVKKAAPPKAPPAPKPVPAPKPRTPAQLKRVVTDKGITVPTGLRKPALDQLLGELERGVTPAEARARAVQTILDERKAVAGTLQDVVEALGSNPSERQLQFWARQVEKLPEELKSSRVLAEALRSGDREAIDKATADLAREAKLKPVKGAAKPGDVVALDRTKMDVIGGADLPPGTLVHVDRPAYEVTVEGRGGVVKATVRPLTPEEIAARQPKKAPAPAKKAAPAKQTTPAVPKTAAKKATPVPAVPKPGAAPESLRASGRDLQTELLAAEHAQGLERTLDARVSGIEPQWMDGRLTYLVRQQEGWSAAGRVVSSEELDQAIAHGWTEMWRGVRTERRSPLDTGRRLPPESAASVARSSQTGEWRMGSGIYGNGFYTTARRTTAEEYRASRFLEWRELEAERNPAHWGPAPLYEWLPGFAPTSGGEGGLMRMALDPEAKVIDIARLRREHRAFLKSEEFKALPEEVQRTLKDSSAYAAMRGYDAIRIAGRRLDDGAPYPVGVAGHKEPPQFIILNRSVLLFERLAS